MTRPGSKAYKWNKRELGSLGKEAVRMKTLGHEMGYTEHSLYTIGAHEACVF